MWRWAAGLESSRRSSRLWSGLKRCICEYRRITSVLLFSVCSNVSHWLCLFCSCTDVNPAAAQCTLQTAHCNLLQLQPVITDLVRHTVQLYTTNYFYVIYIYYINIVFFNTLNSFFFFFFFFIGGALCAFVIVFFFFRNLSNIEHY